MVVSCKPLADLRGHLPLATTNLVLNAVVGSYPSVTLSPAWMKHFVVTVLNGQDRYVPQEKQLPKASSSLTLGPLDSTTVFHLDS